MCRKNVDALITDQETSTSTSARGRRGRRTAETPARAQTDLAQQARHLFRDGPLLRGGERDRQVDTAGINDAGARRGSRSLRPGARGRPRPPRRDDAPRRLRDLAGGRARRAPMGSPRSQHPQTRRTPAAPFLSPRLAGRGKRAGSRLVVLGRPGPAAASAGRCGIPASRARRCAGRACRVAEESIEGAVEDGRGVARLAQGRLQRGAEGVAALHAHRLHGARGVDHLGG